MILNNDTRVHQDKYIRNLAVLEEAGQWDRLEQIRRRAEALLAEHEQNTKAADIQMDDEVIDLTEDTESATAQDGTSPKSQNDTSYNFNTSQYQSQMVRPSTTSKLPDLAYPEKFRLHQSVTSFGKRSTVGARENMDDEEDLPSMIKTEKDVKPSVSVCFNLTGQSMLTWFRFQD